MKTLFQIKETSASSVRHCCRVLSLIAALTAMSNGAWGTTYYLLGSTSGENPTGWSVLATSSTTSFNYTTKHGNQWMGISTTTNPVDRYDTNGKTFVNNCTARVYNYADKEWSGQHMIWLNIDGANDITISYANNTYTISDAAVELSITSVRTQTDQVWVTFDQNIGSISDWTVSDYQTNTQPFSQIVNIQSGNCLYFRTSDVAVNKNNIYRLEYKDGSCFLVTLIGYTYSEDATCTTCSSSCAPSVNISSVKGGDRQLTVNWSVAGMTPTSQTIQYKAGTGEYQNGPAVSASATSATITGLTNGTEYTVKVTATDGTDSPSAEQTGTPSPQLLLPVSVADDGSKTHIAGAGLLVYIDGYPSTTYPQSTTKYSYENVSGSPTITGLNDANPSYLNFLLQDATLSGERVYKITCTENNACAKLTFADGKTVPTVGPCSEAPTPTETPIVYWEKYPTIGNNTIDMFGYLAERWCSPVTDAGFYWKETNDITASDIETPAANHKFLAAANPAKNNDSFSKTTPNLSEIITEPTTIYLVNYVTTAGGGTGISDVVALAYSPCFPIPEGGVTLNNSAVSLPEGYKFTFETTARSAGKTPVYKWYLDDALIEGAASNTYEFTMDEADSHTLKVVVTGDCEVSREATANITSCTMPAVTLAAETSTTPWTDVIITATPTAVASAEWSVEPKAELSGTSTSGATFRAGTPGTYTVKYVGASSACDATVNAEAEIEITVNADSEDCVNPNAE